jgi:hypothetical protein
MASESCSHDRSTTYEGFVSASSTSGLGSSSGCLSATGVSCSTLPTESSASARATPNSSFCPSPSYLLVRPIRPARGLRKTRIATTTTSGQSALVTREDAKARPFTCSIVHHPVIECQGFRSLAPEPQLHLKITTQPSAVREGGGRLPRAEVFRVTPREGQPLKDEVAVSPSMLLRTSGGQSCFGQ